MKLRKIFFSILLILFLSKSTYGAEASLKTYVLTINRLTLEDIENMKGLKKIVGEGSTGLMNTRGISTYADVESFVTINSSNKAFGNYTSLDFKKDYISGKIINHSNNMLVDLNKNNKYSPYIGILGDNVHSIGLKTAIYGSSSLINMPLNTGALIPMDSNGIIDYGNIDNIIIEDNKYPFVLRTDYERLAYEMKNSPGQLIVGDLGDLERIYRYRSSLSEEMARRIREEILVDIDKFMDKFIEKIKDENSLIMIISPNSGDSMFGGSKLSPIIILSDEIGKGILISNTTKREGIVSNIDIAPTILKHLKAPLNFVSGKEIKSIKKFMSIQDIIRYDKEINTMSKSRYNTLYYYGFTSIIAMIMVSFIVVGRLKPTEEMKYGFKAFLTMVLILPILFILASLFKPKTVNSFIAWILILMALSLMIIWLTRRLSEQITIVTGVSALIIMLDLIMKGNISRLSVMSHDPIIGARYYGIGNEMVGLFLGYLIVFSLKMTRKYIPLTFFFISFALIAHPSFGVNIGGAITFIIVIVFYILEVLNKKLNIKNIAIIMILIIASISIIGIFDIQINKDITHLGNNMLLIKEKGIYYVKEIIARKLLMNIKLMGNSFWVYVLFFNIITLTIVLQFKKYNKENLILLIAGFCGIISGFLLNDSGLTLAAISTNIILLGMSLEILK